LPFEAIDRSLSLIDRLNTRQAIEFSIAYTNWRITTGIFGHISKCINVHHFNFFSLNK